MEKSDSAPPDSGDEGTDSPTRPPSIRNTSPAGGPGASKPSTSKVPNRQGGHDLGRRDEDEQLRNPPKGGKRSEGGDSNDGGGGSDPAQTDTELGERTP